MAITTYAELQSAIAEEVEYNPETGVMLWKKSGRGRAKRKGARCGCIRESDGYVVVKVNGRQWLGHRLAWILYYGDEPPKVIDHINRDTADNRISNLRDGTGGVNEMNAKTHSRSPYGITGVRASSKAGGFQAYIAKRGSFQSFYHGNDFFEACCARKSAENSYWEALK